MREIDEGETERHTVGVREKEGRGRRETSGSERSYRRELSMVGFRLEFLTPVHREKDTNRERCKERKRERESERET